MRNIYKLYRLRYIENDISEPIMDGCLKLAVLQQLSRTPLAGYSIMLAIQQETGWKPSPGSIYPLLTVLVKENLATVKASGRRKIYTLTRHGFQALDELRGQDRDIFNRLASQLRVCSPKRADKDTLQFVERLSKGEAPFGWLTGEMAELKRLALLAGMRDPGARNKREIQQSLRTLITALRRSQ